MNNKKIITIVAALPIIILAVGTLYAVNKYDNFNNKTEKDAVIYPAKERVISREDAQARARWQEKGSDLEEKIQKVLPKADYGGVWTNKSNGRFTVGIVETSSTFDSSKQIIFNESRIIGIDDGTDVVPVRYSFATLEQTVEAIHKLYKANVGRDEWPIQVGIKTDLNKVQVHIPADSKNLTAGHLFVLSEIGKKYNDQVFFSTYDELPVNQLGN